MFKAINSGDGQETAFFYKKKKKKKKRFSLTHPASEIEAPWTSYETNFPPGTVREVFSRLAPW
jgi:hypothetical protein